MRKRRWLLFAAVVIALGLGYTAYALLINSATDNLTVSELRSQTASLYSQSVRIEGSVVPGSINWDDKTEEIRFTLTDNKESLIIVYTGVVPDSFKPGTDLVVEGRYRQDDVLEALSFGSRRSFCNFFH
ncbi:cytochrome c maturation protein CcmE [Chloroflexota bacterium]